MKVLHVTAGISQRQGGSKVLLGMCRELQRAGVDAQIASTNADTRGVLDVPLNCAVDVDGVPVYHFASPWARRYGFSPRLSRWLKEHVAEQDVVHVHGLFCYTTMPAIWQASKNGIPYIIRPMGELAPWCLQQGALKKQTYLRWVGRDYLENAAAIHCTAEEEKRNVDRLGFRLNSTVIPLAMDEADFARAPAGNFRRRYPAIGESKIILFLSRIDPVKGLELLVAALARLSCQRTDFMLVIAGEGEPGYERRIRSAVAKQGLSERALFLGFVRGSQKAELLADADIFVLPSHHENFGLAIAEAMAAGVPVIISDQVNIQREVAEAEAGIVTARDPREMVNAFDRLLSDPGRRHSMGANARHLAETRFSWPVVVPQLTRLYNSIAQGRR